MHHKSNLCFANYQCVVSSVAACLALTLACEPAPIEDDELYSSNSLPPACLPDGDGRITRDELPFVTGVRARYRIAEGSIDVQTSGSLDDDGNRVWDLSRPDPSEEPVALLGARPMEDFWFADRFGPGASLAGPFAPDSSLWGPLQIDDDGVHTLGFASSEENPAQGRTLAVYDERVTLYPFPLELGARAVSQARAINARLLGAPTAFDDYYDVEVTQAGRMVLPDLILDHTLRVTVRLERVLLAGDVGQVTHHFMHECIGEVARIVSPARPLDDDIPNEFDTAAQVWRLAL